MFKKWRKNGQVDPTREKYKDELYSFKKCMKHGFPHQPSSLAYDSKLKLMAIGNKSGEIKIVGAPGVEFTNSHHNYNQVIQLHFLNGEGKLVSILDDSSMHLWTLKDEQNGQSQKLVLEKTSQLSGRPGTNQITVVSILSDNSAMWIGTEAGSIYKISLPDLETIESDNIHQDQILQIISDDYKTGKSLGSVETILEHPKTPSLLLIGYNRGLITLWNSVTKSVDNFFSNDKTLESLSWNSNCMEFVSAHSDGYLCTWKLDSSSPLNSYVPYGPFPCKPILKLMWKTARTHPYMIFSGGMPRANYGDRYCVSVIQDTKHVTFDFTSRVIDYFVICKNPKFHEWEDPQFLVVLAEEELVVIDLMDETWPSLPLPYLSSSHASAITCCEHIDAVSDIVFQKIVNLSNKQMKSNADWPITGGYVLNPSSPKRLRNLLLTGHEDGTVKIWEATGVAMWSVLKVQTSTVFAMDNGADDQDESYGEEFPPFRKIGEFDPYSDDPRLAIRKVSMCPLTGTIVAGGTAGQVVVMSLSMDAIETVIASTTVDVLSGRTDFTWKGHEQLDLKPGHVNMKPGYQVSSVLQCQPPASITALNMNANWSLVGLGTSHGFALFDYMQNTIVVSRCTLEAGEQLSLEGHFSRVRSLKMSLRQSMRRIGNSIRSGRGSRRASGRRKNRADMLKKLNDANAALVDEEVAQSGWSPATTGHRRIEARSTDDGMTGMVRCIYFATTYLRDGVSLTPTFWAGTNSGAVFCFVLHIPHYSKRQELPVSFVAGKFIQLKHRAPIIDITVVDGDEIPATSPSIHSIVTNHQLTPATTNNNATINSNRHKSSQQIYHSLIISSEEQIKIFSLPKFKVQRKLRITAQDGSLLKKVRFARFQSKDGNYSEYNLVGLTNIGEIHLFSQIQSIRHQLAVQCVDRENVQAISSTLLTCDTQGFYMSSQSEFQRFTLSSSNRVESICRATSQSAIKNELKSSDDLASSLTDEIITLSIANSDERSAPNSTEVRKRRSPSRTSHKKMYPSSPKTPLLCDHDDEDEEDEDHVVRHESKFLFELFFA